MSVEEKEARKHLDDYPMPPQTWGKTEEEVYRTKRKGEKEEVKPPQPWGIRRD